MKKIKVFEAFAGIGSQTQALKNAKIDHDVVAISEIDKYAIASYEALHGATVNLGDISQISTEDIPDHDLFTYSFPCQDISISGDQEGLDIGSGTRSGLLWECQKVIAVKKPKYLLLENVKNLVGKRHRDNFDKWLNWLESEGYSNYWQVLNAKDYGIPQNRERVFVVSILGNHEEFIFPEKQNLELKLKDLLESSVSASFYLSEKQLSNLKFHEEIPKSDVIELGLVKAHRHSSTANTILSPEGICRTLDTMQGGGREPKVLVKNATKLGYLEATEGDGIDLAYPDSDTRRGRVQKRNKSHSSNG